MPSRNSFFSSAETVVRERSGVLAGAQPVLSRSRLLPAFHVAEA